MDEFAPFDNKLAGLIAALSPTSRRSMAVDIAKKLRQRQQQRIKAQKAPDGTAYAPRKPQPIRGKQGRVKREMFAKLRTNRYLKARGDDNEAVVEFTGKVQRIARVHQYGLKDKPARNHTAVVYSVRPLLGVEKDDINFIEERLLDSLR
ncbi:phage virion morphogenesis protein [Vagococcus sp. WN89Y]|uniref:phage virion morphogenesis protein n=1 Tax=Vagococcus sp. WN89Y TaxID=3457258 RepID=UPI003FCEA038